MKVKTLIKRLQKMPQDVEVGIHDPEDTTYFPKVCKVSVIESKEEKCEDLGYWAKKRRDKDSRYFLKEKNSKMVLIEV